MGTRARCLSACVVVAAVLALAVTPAAAIAGPTSDFTTFTDPITKLANALGSTALGAKQGGRLGSTDAGESSYQKYDKGIIFYSPAFGANFVFPDPVAAVWEANKATLGEPEGASQRFPKANDVTSCAAKKGLKGTITRFAGGGNVYTESGGPYLLKGPTWVKYLQVGDAFGKLGPRTSRSVSTYVAGAGTGFACGWIVEAANLASNGGANAYKPAYVMYDDSPIAKMQQGFGTGQGARMLVVGDPIADEEGVFKAGVKIGLVQRFSQGVIWWSSKTGAQAISGVILSVAGRSTLLEEYESKYKGPMGLMGFPTGPVEKKLVTGPKGSLETIAYMNLEKGVLVFYPSVSGSSMPWGTAQVFTSLSVYLSTFKTYDDATGCDWFCSSQDPYFNIEMKATGYADKNVRIPSSGYFNQNDVNVINSNKGLDVPKVTGNTVISLTFKATDYDDVGSNDALGTVKNTLDITTGWGVWAGTFNAKVSDFRPEYSIKRAADVAALALRPEWRFNYQWAFKNFKTTVLTEDQMADTFTDIARDEFVLAHPFHALFYEYAYKPLAATGNCFGMALASTYAQMGKGPYTAPLGDLGTESARNGGCICSDCTKPCGPGNVAAANKNFVARVNEMHGYQLNCHVGLMGLQMYKKMLETGFLVLNSKSVFDDAESRHKKGEPQLITMMGDKTGHAIRAYLFARDVADAKCAQLGVTKCHIMSIADPNNPYDSGEAGNPDPDKLAVHPSNGRWYYSSKYNNLKAKQFALANVPFSWVSTRGPSIVDNIPWGLAFEIGMLYLFGDATMNVTDQTGKLQTDSNSLVHAFPLPTDIGFNPIIVLPPRPRFYALRRFANGAARNPLKITVKPTGPYTLALKTRDGSFEIVAPKGDGSVDVFELSGYDVSPKAQALKVLPGSAKTLALSLTAPSNARISGAPLVYKLSNLALGGAKGGAEASLLNAGNALKLGSTIAATLKYDLRLSAGISVDALLNAKLIPGLSTIGSEIIVPKSTVVGGLTS